MKHSSFILFALAVVPAVSVAQALPDDPAPATQPVQSTSTLPPASSRPPSPPDLLWARTQRIANGQEVLVTNTYGPPLRCRFAGSTDEFLFCDLPGSPDGAGYRFERTSVLDVRVVRAPHNWHPGLLSAMIGGGLIVGIAATSNTDAGHAARAGIIGALVTGAIAAPMAFLQPRQMNASVGVGLAFHPHRFSHHPHSLMPFHPNALPR